MTDKPDTKPAHAVLGPSAIERWSTCTASVLATKGVVEKRSGVADKGNLCHDIAEALLLRNDAMLKACRANPLWEAEIESYAMWYVDWVNSLVKEQNVVEQFIEREYDLSQFFPESFGTADYTAIVRKHDDSYKLIAVDLKSGKGVRVYAQNNGQLRAYALGAYLEFQFLYHITEVEMWIVQPPFEFDGVSEDSVTPEDLLMWAEDISPKAAEAFYGPGVYMPSEKACQFCKIKNTCAARLESSIPSEFSVITPVNELTEEQLTAELARADQVISWYKNLKDYAYEKAKAGHKWSGWKLVAGRSTRKIADPQALGKKLVEEGFMEEIIYEKSLLGLTALEKVVGKKEFATLAEPFLVKAEGAPTLVPADDRRLEINDASAAFGVIGETE